MANILGNTSVLERVKVVLEADVTLMLYLKVVSVNIQAFYLNLATIQTPAVVLNDLPERFMPTVEKPGSFELNEKVKVKNRIHTIEVNVAVRYLDREQLLIGNAEEVGLIGMAKLVEDALMGNKTLTSTVWDMNFESGWTPVVALDPTGMTQMVGRQGIFEYMGFPETR